MEDLMDFETREDTPPPLQEAHIPDNLLDLWDAMDSLPSPPFIMSTPDFRVESSPDADLLHFLDDSVEFVPSRTANANASNNPAFDFDSEMPSMDYSPSSPKYAPSSPSPFSSGNGSPLGPIFENLPASPTPFGARDDSEDEMEFLPTFTTPSPQRAQRAGGVTIEDVPLSGEFSHNPHSDDFDFTEKFGDPSQAPTTNTAWPADFIVPPPTAEVDYLAEIMRILGLARARRHDESLYDEDVENDFGIQPTEAPRQSEDYRFSSNNTVPLAAENHFPPPSFNVSILDGDLIVDPPSHSNNWDHLEARRMEDRYDVEWLRKVDRAERLFILGPCERKDDDAPILPLHITQRRMNVFTASIQKGTLEDYGGSVWRTVKWCREAGLTPAQIFPMHPKTVLAHLSDFGGRHRPGTIEKILSALKWWHSLHGYELALPKGQWRRILNGCKAIAPPSRKLRPGVTDEDLDYVLSTLVTEGPNASSFDIAFKACILDTYYGMARLGETTVHRVKDNPRTKANATSDNVTFFPATKNTPARATIHIPFDKVAKEKGRDIIIVSQNHRPSRCPLLALKHHIEVNNPPNSVALFSYYEDDARGGAIRQMTKSHLLNHFNKILALDGRPPINGHSFRFGGATFFLTAKVNPDTVKEIGGWRSDSFLRYWRQQSLIAARTMADLKIPTEDGDEVALVDLEGDANEDDYDESLSAASPPRPSLRPSLLITLPRPNSSQKRPAPVSPTASELSSTPSEPDVSTSAPVEAPDAAHAHHHNTRHRRQRIN
ncbi:hypothetical protein P7C70_g6190, partial [Phenoliferia sp. Uapishka_3]